MKFLKNMVTNLKLSIGIRGSIGEPGRPGRRGDPGEGGINSKGTKGINIYQSLNVNTILSFTRITHCYMPFV